MPAPDPVLVPRTGLSVDDTALSHAAIDAFVGALGGRQQFVAILRIGGGDPAVERVLVLLDDPLTAGWSLIKICTHAGLTVADFLRAYQRAMLARGEIAATKVIADGMVSVVADVMRRSAPYEAPCDCVGRPTVKGLGVGPPPLCPICQGSKVKIVLPDLDRQKLALDLAKLLPKTNGVVVQQNTLQLGAGQPPPSAQGSLADLHAAVQQILHPRRTLTPPPSSVPAPAVVEGSIVEEAE